MNRAFRFLASTVIDQDALVCGSEPAVAVLIIRIADLLSYRYNAQGHYC
jgi:hypothetical protein